MARTPGAKNIQYLSHKELLAVDAFIANGGRKKEALVAAGYSETYARGGGHGLFDRPRVVHELEKRRRRLLKSKGLSTEAWVQRAADLLHADVTQFIRIDSEGNPVWDFSELGDDDRANLAAISGLTVEEYKEGRGPGAKDVKRTKITTVDPVRVLELTGKHLGMFEVHNRQKGELSIVDRIRLARRQASQTSSPIDIEPTEPHKLEAARRPAAQ